MKNKDHKRPTTLTRDWVCTQNRDYSTLVAIGAVLALAILSGCATSSVGGSADPYQYNTETGYPAVGGPLWH